MKYKLKQSLNQHQNSSKKPNYPLTAIALAVALSSGQSYADDEQVSGDKTQAEVKTEQQAEKKGIKKDTLFETIQITAQKREASVQSTPISVTAISGSNSRFSHRSH